MTIKLKLYPKTVLSLLVLAAGLIFYFSWSAFHNAWTDLGVYSVTVILVGFGILGTLLSQLPD